MKQIKVRDYYRAINESKKHNTDGNVEWFLGLENISFGDGTVVPAEKFVNVVNAAFLRIMTEYKPFFRYLRNSKVFYLIGDTSKIFGSQMSTMCVDQDRNLWMHVAFIYYVCKMDVDLVFGIIFHELMHNALDHINREKVKFGDVSNEELGRLLNFAQDFEINGHLVLNKVVKENFWKKMGGLHNHKYDGMSWDQIWDKYEDDMRKVYKDISSGNTQNNTDSNNSNKQQDGGSKEQQDSGSKEQQGGGSKEPNKTEIADGRKAAQDYFDALVDEVGIDAALDKIADILDTLYEGIEYDYSKLLLESKSSSDIFDMKTRHTHSNDWLRGFGRKLAEIFKEVEDVSDEDMNLDDYDDFSDETKDELDKERQSDSDKDDKRNDKSNDNADNDNNDDGENGDGEGDGENDENGDNGDGENDKKGEDGEDGNGEGEDGEDGEGEDENGVGDSEDGEYGEDGEDGEGENSNGDKEDGEGEDGEYGNGGEKGAYDEDRKDALKGPYGEDGDDDEDDYGEESSGGGESKPNSNSVNGDAPSNNGKPNTSDPGGKAEIDKENAKKGLEDMGMPKDEVDDIVDDAFDDDKPSNDELRNQLSDDLGKDKNWKDSSFAKELDKISMDKELTSDQWDALIEKFLKSRTLYRGSFGSHKQNTRWGSRKHLWNLDVRLDKKANATGTPQCVNLFIDCSQSVQERIVYKMLENIIAVSKQFEFSLIRVWGFSNRLTSDFYELDPNKFESSAYGNKAVHDIWDFLKGVMDGFGESFEAVAKKIAEIREEEPESVYIICGDAMWSMMSSSDITDKNGHYIWKICPDAIPDILFFIYTEDYDSYTFNLYYYYVHKYYDNVVKVIVD